MIGVFVGTLAVGTTARADALCEAQGEIAQMIMKARQDGTPKKAAMDFAEKGDALIQPMVTEIVRLAYARPQMKTERERRKEVLRFTSAIERDCMRDVN